LLLVTAANTLIILMWSEYTCMQANGIFHNFFTLLEPRMGLGAVSKWVSV